MWEMFEINFEFANGINWTGTASWGLLRLWVHELSYGYIYFSSSRVHLLIIGNMSLTNLMCVQWIFLSISLDEEFLLELCSLGGRSTMGDGITVFCWWYWYLFSYFFLFSFNRMELLECCILLMSIEEGVGGVLRMGGGEKYDDKVGRGG